MGALWQLLPFSPRDLLLRLFTAEELQELLYNDLTPQERAILEEAIVHAIYNDDDIIKAALKRRAYDVLRVLGKIPPSSSSASPPPTQAQPKRGRRKR